MDASEHWKADELKKELDLTPSALLGILAVTKCPLQSNLSWYSLVLNLILPWDTLLQCPPGSTSTWPIPFGRCKITHTKIFSSRNLSC